MSRRGSSRGGGDGRGCKARDRGPRRRTRRYVEESDRAQRSRHARIRRRSRSPARHAGYAHYSRIGYSGAMWIPLVLLPAAVALSLLGAGATAFRSALLILGEEGLSEAASAGD